MLAGRPNRRNSRVPSNLFVWPRRKEEAGTATHPRAEACNCAALVSVPLAPAIKLTVRFNNSHSGRFETPRTNYLQFRVIPSRPQDVRSEYRPLENSETVRVLLPLFRRTTCPSGAPKPRTVPTQQAARAEPLFRPGRVPSSADRSPSLPATALNRNRSPARTGPHKARCRDPRRNPRRNDWTKQRSPHE